MTPDAVQPHRSPTWWRDAADGTTHDNASPTVWLVTSAGRVWHVHRGTEAYEKLVAEGAAGVDDATMQRIAAEHDLDAIPLGELPQALAADAAPWRIGVSQLGTPTATITPDEAA